MPRKENNSKHIAIPVLPVPRNDAEAVGIFNTIFGTKYTVEDLKELFSKTKKKDVAPGGDNFQPVSKQVELKEGCCYVGPLTHVATKDLFNELGKRSMGFLCVMVTVDRNNKDQWQFACAGSNMTINTLINAAVFEGRQYLENHSNPY